MKKLLLLAGAAMLATSASATTWAVVGAYTTPNWNFEASTVLEGDGAVLSCEIESLLGDFKIVDIDDSSWGIQYGTATPIELGKTYVLDGKDGGDDPANIKFAGDILEVKDATVTWNPTTFELEVTGTAITGLPTLYATGSFNGWTTPGDDPSLKCDLEGEVYTVLIDLGDSGDVQFKLAGAGWSNEIAGGVEVGYEPVEVTKGGDNLKTSLTGEQTLVFDYASMTMYFASDDEGGIESIGIDLNAPAVYYNLNGVKVSNPQNGIFIVKQGTKTAKVMVK